MKYTRYFIFAILLFSSPSLANAEQYLCVAEKSAGFKYEEGSKSWESKIFKTDSKYIISQEEFTKRYKVTEVGNKFPLCKS